MARRLLRAGLACYCMLSASVATAEPAPFMMRATVKGRTIEGQPLMWNANEMLLLGRDGALQEFAPDDAKNAKKFGSGFVGYTSEELKAKLRDEFDRSFDISTTPHFVVVHPHGEWREWAERLESLYRSFTHYMNVRGLPTANPQTPLTAIVFRTQEDYYRHAAAGGTPLQPGTMGHYDPTNNRVYLFDAAEKNGDASWATNAETIIHEATHQTAYNVGVHRRFAEQPRWLVEGLAMMFEARGVWDNASLRQQADRINAERLANFRESASKRPADWLVQLVASDQPFQRTPLSAYAAAWTLTFYLCETRPQEYSRYLAIVAARPAFSEYPPQARLADFTSAFGNDLPMLAVQLQRYVDVLP